MVKSWLFIICSLNRLLQYTFDTVTKIFFLVADEVLKCAGIILITKLDDLFTFYFRYLNCTVKYLYLKQTDARYRKLQRTKVRIKEG